MLVFLKVLRLFPKFNSSFKKLPIIGDVPVFMCFVWISEQRLFPYTALRGSFL